MANRNFPNKTQLNVSGKTMSGGFSEAIQSSGGLAGGSPFGKVRNNCDGGGGICITTNYECTNDKCVNTKCSSTSNK